MAAMWRSSGPGPAVATAVMQLFTSTNGGASFGAASEIAPIGNELLRRRQRPAGDRETTARAGSPSSTRRAAGRRPQADPPASTGPNTSRHRRPPLHREDATITTAVGGNLLTLKVPGTCLASLQPFYVGVGKKARHKIAKALRSKLKVVKVTFSFDGRRRP